MSEFGAVARVVLGAVFLVSSVAKLRDPHWPAAAERFGLPRRLALPLAVLELVLGAGLVAHVAPPVPSFVALGLLGLFTGAVVAHVARGDDVPCACFGPASASTPVSWATVARNVILCLLALAATWQ